MRTILFAVCTLLPAGLFAQTGTLDHLRADWEQALMHQDLEGSMALFTPDAVFLAPDGSRYDDRAAIRTLYKSVIAAYHAQIHLTSKKEECSGKLCVDEGTYSELLTETATGKKLDVSGSYLMAARRDTDGKWKIAELAWAGSQSSPR